MPINYIRLAVVSIFGLAVAATTQSSAQAAPSFSARIMKTGPQGPGANEIGALHVQGDMARLEMADLPNGFFLVDAAKPSAYYVRPQRKVFMDARQTNMLTRILLPAPAGDPCPAWQSAAVLAGIVITPAELECKPAGDARVGDQPTQLFRLTSPTHKTTTVWLAGALGFPVRVLTDDGARYDLFDIRQEPQAATLFDLPSDFGKFDPVALINRIKQSDVWVEPAK